MKTQRWTFTVKPSKQFVLNRQLFEILTTKKIGRTWKVVTRKVYGKEIH